MSKHTDQLSSKEIAMIKGLLDGKKHTNQAILNMFSVPARTVNSGRISEIKAGNRGRDVASASKKEVDRFLQGEIKLHDLAGQLFSLDREEEIFSVKYSVETLYVSTLENESLEYKEKFERESIPVYLKILAGMLNAGFESGGIIFGISDSPRKIVGVKDDLSAEFLNPWCEIIRAHFAPFFSLRTEKAPIPGNGRRLLGVFLRHENAPTLPIICCKAKNVQKSKREKPVEALKESAIYYRYGPSTLKIGYPELRCLIDRLAKRNKAD